MSILHRTAVAVALVLCLHPSVAPAQTCPGPGDWASSVVSWTPGPGITPGAAFGDPTLLLCQPLGSLDVLTLGAGGSVTLGFDQPIVDGPGTDFITWENGFAFGGLVFGELTFVEVSTNGTDFARFPAEYYGPQVPLGPFDGIPQGGGYNLVGIGLLPMVPPSDLLDPARGGGDAFDLSELAGDPLVQGGVVDLAAINFVRLVDLVGDGSLRDSRGVPIYDPTGTASSADVDAVGVVHHAGNQAPGRPVVTVDFSATMRTLSITLQDPQGLGSLDFTTLRAAISGIPVDLLALLEAFPQVTLQPDAVTLTSVPLPAGVFATFSVSVADLGGLRGGDRTAVRP